MSEAYRPPTSARPDDKNHQQYQQQQQQQQVDRRGQFANRMRTASSGSTRGAFGLMPVDASASNPEDIRQRQQQYDRQHNHGRYHAHGQGQGQGQGHTHGQSKKKQLSLPTPGQSINRESGNAVRDEEHGGYGTHGNVNGNVNGNGGGGYSPRRDMRQRHQYQHQGQSQGQGHVYNHQPLPNHPRSQQQRQQQQQQQYDQQQYVYQFNPNNNNSSMQYQDINYSDEVNNSMNYSKSTNFDYSSNSNIISDRDLSASTKLIANNINNIRGNDTNGAAIDNGHYPHKNQSGGRNDNHPESSDGGSRRSDFNNDGEEDQYGKEDQYHLTWYEHLIFNKHNPEFSTLQQLVWAVFIGIAMGFFTALWGDFIEFCVEFTWKTVPEYLLEKGVFTDLEGSFPLPYYMVLCPAVFGGVLSYITAILVNPKVPGQNEWIESLHRVGVMDDKMFVPVILIATAGMASGLSLGPEMPLVLSAGMIGSKIATQCKQSVLSARVMNLTAASAGIGGFFGLPMAGALFVLELPHRMGLQYFEALSPATLASIVSVIVNRLITKNEVKGMFDYPFLNESLPSSVFWVVIIYGFFGSFVGACYAEGLLWLKHWVHEWFHAPHDDHEHMKSEPYHNAGGESMPLVGNGHKQNKVSCCTWVQKGVQRFFGIEYEPTRATVAGVLVGLIVGLNCMLLPHNLFWGEAQLQTMIDRGATRLPVFGYDDEPTSNMTAYGYCLVEPGNATGEHEGFSTACAGTMAVTKLIIVGLSLGTGVCGGHFWAPLFVACASSHFFTDMMAILSNYLGFGSDISAYPCLAVLCIMGSAHVVTFRAQLAIILVLTLSIGSFSAGDTYFASNGDYSAVFPLLVVACFVPLLLTRNVVFYAKQCCRGDISAIPEVLCEPYKPGTAQIYRIDNMGDFDNSSASYGTNDDDISADSGSDDSYGDVDLGPNNSERDITLRTVDTTGDSGTMATSSTKPSTVTNASLPAVDQLSLSMHSTSSKRSRSSTNSRPSGLKRVNSIGKIDDSNYQKPLLHQGREGASTVKKGPNIPRHRRSRSSVSTGSNFSPPKDIDTLDKSKH